MNQSTILALNNLNAEFYSIANTYLNHSDHVYRFGWDDLLKIVKAFELELKIVDIGCGDGRFGAFLANNNLKIQSYIGIDNSKYSLEIASKKLEKTNILNTSFIYRDLISDKDNINLIPDGTNLVVMIGLFHHLPSQEFRLKFMQNIVKDLKEGTKVIWTTFRYLDIPRLKRQVLDLNDIKISQMLKSKYELNINELETGDAILEWRKILENKEIIKAYRYSHYFNSFEINQIITESGLILLDDFIEQGNEGGLNRYLICQKK